MTGPTKSLFLDPPQFTPIVGLVVFRDRLYCATANGLWVKDGDKMVPVKFLSIEDVTKGKP